MTRPPGNFGTFNFPRNSEGTALKEMPEFKFARVDGVLPRTRVQDGSNNEGEGKSFFFPRPRYD